MASFKRVLLDVLAPRVRCMGCEKAVAQSDGLCPGCRQTLRPLRDVCPRCGFPGEAGQRCPRCLGESPPYAEVYCLYPHEGVARRLVHLQKYSGEYELPCALFAAGLKEAILEKDWPVELVVPVPSRKAHLREHGYNQAEKLARAVARPLGLRCLPHALKREGNTQSQVGLDREARLQNSRKQYVRGRQAKALMGKTLLLVDDVYTTGATVFACTQALLDLGARAVYVACATKSLPKAPTGE